jgi:hypothetical protein
MTFMHFPTEKVQESLNRNDVPATCMDCQKECNTWEIVYTGDEDSQDGFEVWAYCRECDIETFHIIPKLSE